jgi:hypothetical protein
MLHFRHPLSNANAAGQILRSSNPVVPAIKMTTTGRSKKSESRISSFLP